MSTKKPDDDLIGFRDFIDQEPKQKPVNDKRQVGHEMATFLERESSRMGNLVDFFEEKVFMLKHFEQYNQIRQKANAQLFDKRQKVANSLFEEGRSLKKNIDEILRTHFRN